MNMRAVGRGELERVLSDSALFAFIPMPMTICVPGPAASIRYHSTEEDDGGGSESKWLPVMSV